MTKLPFRPRAHWVVVARDPEKATTLGGLEIPQAHRTKMSRGTVLAVGDGIVSDAGHLVTVRGIEVDDVVQWAESGGYEIEVLGAAYTFVPAANVVLVEDRA